MKEKESSILNKIWDLTKLNSGELQKISKHVAVLNSEMGGVQKEIVSIKEGYVRNEAFSPVQKLVYGFAGAVLLAVIGSILALVIVAR